MKQTTLLARTFFVKLFESELMPAGLPQVQLMIWSVVLIATPTLTLPGMFAQKYTGLWAKPGTLSAAINTDRMVLITFAMIALGFVALVIWESVFPDRRDARILGALPISTPTFVAARTLAVAALFGLFFATLGAIPSVLFGCLTASYLSGRRVSGRHCSPVRRGARGGAIQLHRRDRAPVFSHQRGRPHRPTVTAFVDERGRVDARITMRSPARWPGRPRAPRSCRAPPSRSEPAPTRVGGGWPGPRWCPPRLRSRRSR